MLRLPIVAASILTLCASTQAQEWPTWRGPTRDGHAAADATPPLTWSEQENIRWKAPIPGTGASTPCVRGARLYLTSAVPTGRTHTVPGPPPNAAPVTVEEQGLLVLAYDRATGDQVWKTELGEAVPAEKGHELANYAAASPVVDATHVYAFFGSLGLFCLDLDGAVVWSKDLGDQRTLAGFGEGASPVLADGVLVVPWDQEGPSFLLGLDAATGEELWRRPRQTDSAWSTPLIAEVDGSSQVIVTGSGATDAYDLRTGAPVWTCQGMTGNPVVGATLADGVLYVTNSYKGKVVQAIRPAEARGDISGSDHVLWTYRQAAAYVPMPVVDGGLLYFLRDSTGVLHCLDAASGEPVYEAKRLQTKRIHASPTLAGGRLYFAARDGKTFVVQPGREFAVLATNTLDDVLDATPVAVGDCLYLRGHTSLYCIAAED